MYFNKEEDKTTLNALCAHPYQLGTVNKAAIRLIREADTSSVMTVR